MRSGLFNQEAVEQLSTPEQLDQRVRMLSSGTWILFAAVLISVFAVFAWAILGNISVGENYNGVLFDSDDVESLTARSDGILQDILVDEGDAVSEGDIIAVVANDEISDKIAGLRERQAGYPEGSRRYRELGQQIRACNDDMMLRIAADGIVQRVLLAGTAVRAGDVVSTIVPRNSFSYKEVYIYVSREEAGALEIGMAAQITPSYVTREEYGYMEGIVSDISENIVTENHIIKHMGTMDYVEELMPSDNCVEVTIQLSVDNTADGLYVWSNPKGSSLDIKSGDQCDVRILKKEYHPYELLLDA